ncbi:MAG: putative lipid II flippase FtsW [Terrabacter sp.]|nr:putative lipid II flippase FtsW [Dermatophilaceae bacterium]NUR15995.1 putative lipid II flippase FtsW [Dermatophilaceae bacterium]NUR80903.1 putative lipid II flippase FtsW [Dermatophilaceae bacterium]NUS40554.1 putative lipid II flippase FtsW [Terrabacter sp.]
MSATTADDKAGTASSGPRPLPVIGKLESPLTTYYLILGATSTLVVFGLIMVFSASSVEALIADEASYSIFVRQLLFAVIGAVLAGVASRLDVSWWKRLAFPTMVVSVLLLAAVIPFGKTVNGNRNWISLGPVQFQPAEFAKVGLVLVGAVIFANKSSRMASMLHVALPYLIPIATVVLGLILAGHDLGTAMVVLVVIAAVLLVAGAPMRVFAIAGGLAAAGVAVMVTGSSNRMDRIARWMDPTCQADPDGWCGQSVHGLYALADGGWWGVGLGASKEKWEWLSEAHNDFIFAIIGEELGLPGTLMILLLFGILAWACFRLVSRTQDRFVRIAGFGIMAWLLGQAIINIGAVIGLFPVIGVPLPLVSAGGSSLVTTLVALGILLSFARNEPGCKALLDARPSLVRRSLSVLPSRVRSVPQRRRSR